VVKVIVRLIMLMKKQLIYIIKHRLITPPQWLEYSSCSYS